MGDKKHRNPIRIATTTQVRENEAINALLSRELLYNRNNKTLGIVLEDEEGNKYRQIVSGLVDEVNITKNENYETKLKEDIVIDTVTTQADHKGLDWKSQSKIAETTAERTVILLCTQDVEATTDIGVIGGELLEVGVGVYGHYQMSLTSTGSRLFKGATTFGKKAKLVLAKYNGTYYYGIKFKSAVPANIYFAGWAHIPGGISAPSYTVYNDGDLSEIIELDDDSDTGTQVIEYKFLTYKDLNWEFKSRKDSNFSTSPSSSGSGTSQVYDWGNGLTMYPNTGNKTEVRIATYWNSVVVSGTDAIVWKVVVDSDNAELNITVKNWVNNRSCNIVLYGSDENGDVVYRTLQNVWVEAGATSATLRFTNLAKGTYWIRQGDGGQSTQIEYYAVNVIQDFAPEVEGWVQNGDNSGFDLGEGLILLTSKDTRYEEAARNGDYGNIRVASSTSTDEPLAKLTVVGPCTIKVGASRGGSATSRLRITETLDTSDPKWNDSVVQTVATNNVTEVEYQYKGSYGTTKDIYFINEGGSVYWYYVRVDYPDLQGQGAVIRDLILGLGDTGEDGSPHIIRLNGTITRDSLVTIASAIRDNSNKQVILDLSKCTMEAGYEDWGADDEDQYGQCLNSLFHNCVGLREFYYPHNVIATGGGTFQNCSFLRKIVLNPEMQYVGGAATWAFSNNAWLAGCRLKTMILPKSVKGLGSYWAADSNLINVYVEDGSAFLNQGNAVYRDNCHWCCFPNTKEMLRFKVTQSLYDVWHNNSMTFSGLGASEDNNQDFFIKKTCYWRDHIELWDGDIDAVEYQA